MATLDDILGYDGGGGGTPAPKGSQEWHWQQESIPPASPPAKGTQEWAEQNSGENAPPSAPAQKKETPATTSTTTATTQPSGGGGMSYADMFKKLNPYHPPTEEELEKEKKRQKRELLFSAIGDGIAALSNLFFTTQYAPNMYSGKNTLSERAQARYDKLKKERDENNANYFNGLMRAMQADERKAEADREWMRTLGLDDYNRKRNDAKDERERQLFDLNVKLQNHKISAAEAESIRKSIESQYAEELARAKIDTEKARAKAQESSAQANYSRAKSYNSGGSKYYGNFNGKDYKTEADYNHAVIAAAKELDVDITEKQVYGEDLMGKPKVKDVRRTIHEIVADIETKKKKKKENPMN